MRRYRYIKYKQESKSQDHEITIEKNLIEYRKTTKFKETKQKNSRKK